MTTAPVPAAFLLVLGLKTKDRTRNRAGGRTIRIATRASQPRARCDPNPTVVGIAAGQARPHGCANHRPLLGALCILRHGAADNRAGHGADDDRIWSTAHKFAAIGAAPCTDIAP